MTPASGADPALCSAPREKKKEKKGRGEKMQPVGVDGQRSVQRSRSIPKPAWSSAGYVRISEATAEPLLEGHATLYIITLTLIGTRRACDKQTRKLRNSRAILFSDS